MPVFDEPPRFSPVADRFHLIASRGESIPQFILHRGVGIDKHNKA
jgi:hypothetical protein